MLIPAPKHSREKNDCVVHALAAALGTDYGRAHRICRRAGRVCRRGFNTEQALITAYMEWNVSFTRHKFAPSISPQEFALRNPKGRFIVTVWRHALAVVDGQVIDNLSKPSTRRLMSAYEIKV